MATAHLRYQFAKNDVLDRSGNGKEFRSSSKEYRSSSIESNLPPFFERIGNDDFNEVQHCKVIIEQQQQRLKRLEKINMDLEYRLEEQAKQSMAVEAECIAIEKKWKEICEKKDAEIETLEKNFENEKKKGVLLCY